MPIKVTDVAKVKKPDDPFKDVKGEVHYVGELEGEEIVYLIFHKSLIRYSCSSNFNLNKCCHHFFAGHGYCGPYGYKRSEISISLSGYTKVETEKILSWQE